MGDTKKEKQMIQPLSDEERSIAKYQLIRVWNRPENKHQNSNRTFLNFHINNAALEDYDRYFTPHHPDPHIAEYQNALFATLRKLQASHDITQTMITPYSLLLLLELANNERELIDVMDRINSAFEEKYFFRDAYEKSRFIHLISTFLQTAPTYPTHHFEPFRKFYEAYEESEHLARPAWLPEAQTAPSLPTLKPPASPVPPLSISEIQSLQAQPHALRQKNTWLDLLKRDTNGEHLSALFKRGFFWKKNLGDLLRDDPDLYRNALITVAQHHAESKDLQAKKRLAKQFNALTNNPWYRRALSKMLRFEDVTRLLSHAEKLPAIHQLFNFSQDTQNQIKKRAGFTQHLFHQSNLATHQAIAERLQIVLEQNKGIASPSYSYYTLEDHLVDILAKYGENNPRQLLEALKKTLWREEKNADSPLRKAMQNLLSMPANIDWKKLAEHNQGNRQIDKELARGSFLREQTSKLEEALANKNLQNPRKYYADWFNVCQKHGLTDAEIMRASLPIMKRFKKVAADQTTPSTSTRSAPRDVNQAEYGRLLREQTPRKGDDHGDLIAVIAASPRTFGG